MLSIKSLDVEKASNVHNPEFFGNNLFIKEKNKKIFLKNNITTLGKSDEICDSLCSLALSFLTRLYYSIVL